MRLLAVLMTVTLAFAGCTKDTPDEGHAGPTAEECEAQGLILGEREVTDHESTEGNDTTMDQDTMEPHTEPACVEPLPPATVRVEGLPESVQAYTPVAFEWILETPIEENHAMRTEVRSDTSLTAGACDDQDLQKPDDWGSSVALKEHQNFVSGQSYEASWTPTEPGEYCFRGYALVQQKNIWSQVYHVNVTEVQPTGVTHDVTASNGGAPTFGAVAPADLTIEIGDAVQWLNGNPGSSGSWTIAKSSGPEGQDISTTAGGDAVLFVIPGSYGYTATGDLGSVSGTITVAVPA